MNQTSLTDDQLDQLLSHYLKSQLPDPWPGAPDVLRASEPSSLVAERSTRSENDGGNQTSPRRNRGNSSRYTLAASVVALLGACWALSNTAHPETSLTNSQPAPAGINLGSTTADGKSGLPGAIAGENAKSPKNPMNVQNPFGKQ